MPDRAHATRLMTVVLASVAMSGPLLAGDGGSFEKSVRPVLTEHCLRCHGPDKQKGGLRVDSRAALLSGGESGPAIVPGKPDESLLVQAVRHQDLKMPPAGKLPDAVTEVLAQWIKDGADWPVEKTPGGAANGHAGHKPGVITDADRKWWAFQSPKRPAVPAAGAGWARNAIDHFVAARLETAQLDHAPEADRATLIRRITFDLTGLPPTPAEVDAFLQDASPTAYEKAVDRLLASPRYGERMGRAWLDLVRYAESDGYRLDTYRPNAWRYRDYVVRSLNADKGYDRFVREQLAGDELYPDDPDASVATGFLRLWPYEYNQKDARGQLASIHTDITDVTGDALLGLGFQCARCHDHKFDPILQKDYYALRAFFAGVVFRDEPVFSTPAARSEYEQKLAAWESRTAALRARYNAIFEPAVKVAAEGVLERFPPDVQTVLRKPSAERSPGEQQLAELAFVQINYLGEQDAPRRVPKDKKPEFDRLKKELTALTAERPAAPVAMIARDAGPVAADVVVPGGRKGPSLVEPAFPVVLGASPPAITSRPSSSGRRTALADWLTRPDHPLTARVMANRLWQAHFGAGLVTTPSDFGTLGEKPSHPELLDWLAVEFVEKGWSMKHLHRLLVTSATYRQASAFAPKAVSARPHPRVVDPENRLLWRMPVRRLDAEQVRDAFLAVGGELDLTAGGPAVPADKPRRSVYTRMTRNTPYPLLAAFDAADGVSSCARRNITITPTQSLLLFNGADTLVRASAFAARVMPADGKDAPKGVDAAYRLAFGRAPTTDEAAAALAFLHQQVGVGTGKAITPAVRRAAWTDFCHALLNANEFLFID